MGAITGAQILVAFGAGGLAVLMIPKTSRFRSFLFLLLTGVGVLLGVGLTLGSVTSIFD